MSEYNLRKAGDAIAGCRGESFVNEVNAFGKAVEDRLTAAEADGAALKGAVSAQASFINALEASALALKSRVAALENSIKRQQGLIYQMLDETP